MCGIPTDGTTLTTNTLPDWDCFVKLLSIAQAEDIAFRRRSSSSFLQPSQPISG